MRTIDRVKKRFALEGLDSALDITPTNRIYRKRVDGEAESHLIVFHFSVSMPPVNRIDLPPGLKNNDVEALFGFDLAIT